MPRSFARALAAATLISLALPLANARAQIAPDAARVVNRLLAPCA